MDKEKQINEPFATYAASPRLDLSRLTIVEQDGQPVAVLVPFQEYQKLMEERRRSREDWRKRFSQLLADIHSRMPDLPAEQVEADITKAFEEMKTERYGARPA